MTVVRADQPPEDRRASGDKSRILSSRPRRRFAVSQDRERLLRGFRRTHHGERHTGGKDRIEKTSRITNEKVSGARVGLALIAEIGKHLVRLRPPRMAQAMADHRTSRYRP